ncbi:hypothetical protein [Alteraurantiacibacter palmitatis]|uniref:DUF2059 domain-containing protein n=1 Tax=Alteraurantiacibacter palmitatis TaxID=2054628 RepID=A0ABV7E708_9SPHN
MTRFRLLALAASLCGLALTGTPASAQINIDLNEEEMATFALAAMPAALRSVQAQCRPVLDADAYMFAQSDALTRRLTATSDRAFPGASRSIVRIAARGNPAMGEIMSAMPPETLRPLLNEFVAGMVTQRVDPSRCEQIDRVLALLDPLPPENLARLAAIAMSEAQADTATGTARGR